MHVRKVNADIKMKSKPTTIELLQSLVAYEKSHQYDNTAAPAA